MTRLILSCVLLLGIGGCQNPEFKPFPTGATHVEAIFGSGIEVRATVIDFASFLPGSGTDFGPGAESAVITTAKHRIVVDKEHVTIDGVEFTKLPMPCRYVEIWLDGEGHFSMNTDGKGVATMSKQLAN